MRGRQYIVIAAGGGKLGTKSGDAYVAGYTLSNDFPMVNPLQATRNGEDVFVLKLNPAGDGLLYSTFLGGTGTDEPYGIALDASRRKK